MAKAGKDKSISDKKLILWYPFDDEKNIGKDISGNKKDAKPKGKNIPVIEKVKGRKAAHIKGGEFGASYFELPEDILKGVNDNTGLTISAWVCADIGTNVWERIYDFGNGHMGPYIFLTRCLRDVCFNGLDIVADAGMECPANEWVYVTVTITGTKDGTLSSAGPRVYVDGELVADGFISQTSSGVYKRFREWCATLENTDNYRHNYIGHSQFSADMDFCGSISDFRIYADVLDEEEIIGIMCESLNDEQILKLAKDKFLLNPPTIITKDLIIPKTLIDGRVSVEWVCDKPKLFSSDGIVNPSKKPEGVKIKAVLKCGDKSIEKDFRATVLSKNIAPYELTINGNKEVLDISKTLFGLFYEDINNAADGGIYAEMINNRSFEAFEFDTYDARSGQNGRSTGRRHNPLSFWFGDTDKVTVKNEGGLNEYFGLKDKDANAYYIDVLNGTKLYNRGFCDETFNYAMNIKKDLDYSFTIWAKPEDTAEIKVTLLDKNNKKISNTVVIKTNKPGKWKKYKADKLIAKKSALGQILIEFKGNTSIDMVSLIPGDVWGAKKEKSSATAHKNFKGNPNYRLRRDLVEVLTELHPTFLRFPGGCISEGSYIWDNVYDWKDSVGEVETRKENFNVWGYNMTLGLGYMEYFQLAEDLNAEPLPVMACGVLCQARSDYANPAGGKLQKKYIKNFTDLIDFAINTDFENNEWAALRKKMGHPEPFGLHYLGVGNENWETEFYASFEAFKYAIDKYVKKNYPHYNLTIISTVGAQADDISYEQGWKFLAGYMEGGAKVEFTDGVKSFEEDITWYKHNKNYLDTIVDEHYYRSNEYLLENADRYNYYYRSYKKGVLNDINTSKVFVGEYASSDKNTLAGAVAEAAVMTGFERNSDVVRLAATAPLFNKVVSDGKYRWTPDAIWFDNETVWRTPNYYVQQLFAKYIGNKLLSAEYASYADGERKPLIPHGGIVISSVNGEVVFKNVKVVSNKGKKVLFEQDFSKPIDEKLTVIEGTVINFSNEHNGVIVSGNKTKRSGFYIDDAEWSNYTIELTAFKLETSAQIRVGAGLVGYGGISSDTLNLLEYCVGIEGKGTGLKVFKNGKEAYRMGDYAASTFAGNLRACYDKPVAASKEYKVTVNFGGKDKEHIICYYADENKDKNALLECKLEAYNRDIYYSITKDEKKVYVKLVNAESFDKKLKLEVSKLNVKNKAEIIVLTGDSEFLHVPNINTKEEEKIVPKTSSLKVKDNKAEFVLLANSVSIVVFDIK